MPLQAGLRQGLQPHSKPASGTISSSFRRITTSGKLQQDFFLEGQKRERPQEEYIQSHLPQMFLNNAGLLKTRLLLCPLAGVGASPPTHGAHRSRWTFSYGQLMWEVRAHL